MMSLHGIPIRGWIAAIHGRFITNCRKAVKQHCLDRLGDEGAGFAPKSPHLFDLKRQKYKNKSLRIFEKI